MQINLLEQFFAATKPRGEPDTDRFVPPVRVNWFGGATEKIVGRAHDRPSWSVAPLSPRVVTGDTAWNQRSFSSLPSPSMFSLLLSSHLHRGRLAHRGTEWTEELATAYARHEAYRIANSFAMLDKVCFSLTGTWVSLCSSSLFFSASFLQIAITATIITAAAAVVISSGQDIDLHTIPDSAFDPSCNRFAEQNPDLTREELIAYVFSSSFIPLG